MDRTVRIKASPDPLYNSWNERAGLTSFTFSFVAGIHDNALALWGTPLGELWDLEALAEECKRQGRWSFFVTSCPLNVSGGVASPPNALAIF